MKLAALCCVAALSLTGCVDDPTGGGGYLAGMRPAKPSLENPNNSPLPTNPEIFGGMNQRSSIRIPDLAEGVYAESVKPPVPMEGVCDNCEVIAFRLTDDNSGLEEIRVFSDGGVPLCRIFIDAGTVIHDDCGWTR